MHNIQQYSSSSESDEENDDPQKNKGTSSDQQLPSSKDLLQEVTTAETTAPESDPSKHQGRVRSFAHERGIWASYVFVDYNDVDPLNDLQQQIIDLATKEFSLELHRVDNLHLSLTKTFVLRHHNISAFVDNVRSAVAGIKRFTITLSDLAVYTNEENTRTFLAVRMHDQSYGPLCQLVSNLDGCMREYKLPEFYADPSFHVSILWCLGNQRKQLEDNLVRLQEIFAAIYEEDFCDMNVSVKQLHFKCGNKFYSFDLL